MSRVEFDSVVDAIAREVGSRADAIEEMTDKKPKDYASIAYLDDSEKQINSLKMPIIEKPLKKSCQWQVF